MAQRFDYDILFFNAKGEKMGGNTYQELLKRLDIGDEIIEGKPLRVGGVPQVMSVARIVAMVSKADTFKIYFNGSQIA